MKSEATPLFKILAFLACSYPTDAEKSRILGFSNIKLSLTEKLANPSLKNFLLLYCDETKAHRLPNQKSTHNKGAALPPTLKDGVSALSIG